MDPCPERCDHCLDLRVSVDLIQPCLFYIEDLSSQGQDCLGRTVSRCLCGTAGGISLYDIDLAFRRVFVRTVRQLARKGCAVESGFSSRQVPCLPRRFSRSLRHHRFFNRDLCHIRILLEEYLKLGAQDTAHSSPCLAVSKFLLCLSLKLRILDLYTDDRCQSFPDILTRKFFVFFYKFILFCVIIKCLC